MKSVLTLYMLGKQVCNEKCFSYLFTKTYVVGTAGPCTAVSNMSGYRCVSDCRSRVASSILARSHAFLEIDHEIISTAILLPSADSFKNGCCQFQMKVCARITG